MNNFTSHQSFIVMERMQSMIQAELSVNYHLADSIFGKLMIASSAKGICFLAFEEDETLALNDLKRRLPQAVLHRQTDDLQQNALSILQNNRNDLPLIKLHLRGTDFQFKVWERLLEIPKGQLSTYAAIAEQIGYPKACRAVGTAVGSNPVSFLVPCHRVIQSSGKLGGYHWGIERKKAILEWEKQ